MPLASGASPRASRVSTARVPSGKSTASNCAGFGQGGSVVARIGDQQEQVMDVAIGLFQVLAAQQRLKIANPGLRDHADPHAPDDQQDIPCALVIGLDRCLKMVTNPVAQSRQEALD